MTEQEARRVLLVQAHDAAPGPLWTPEDAQWASRLADETTPAEAPAEQWAVQRARHALERLQPRSPAVQRWLSAPQWRWRWWLAALAVGLVAGLAADLLGHGQRVDVLAPLLWAVVAWNLAIYALLVLNALRIAPGLSSHFRQLLARLWQRGAAEGALADATLRWADVARNLYGARAAALLHGAAGTFGLGLLAGLYWRGLVLDYRAGWQSTFIEPGILQALLGVLMAPARALTGLALPDEVTLSGMRLTPQNPVAQASAALWIHLYAATLLLWVVLPRAALTGLALLRARWLASHVRLSGEGAGVRRLDKGRKTGRAPLVQVLPYAQTPAATTALGLRQLLAEALGDALVLKMADTTPIGQEDSVAARAGPAETSLRVALADMTATPEAEHHGRLCQALTAVGDSVAWLLLVDEAAYRVRFGSLPGRLTERREAWQAFAEAQGVRLAVVNLDQPEHPDSLSALKHALDA
jgi:Protein of unknown function (DUF2868)